ncbi:MAG: hypothetical protein LBE59_10855, partial [Nevskiaceae bacterium]|nr:hypothetical protein [Nevskiaceae bacterium]
MKPLFALIAMMASGAAQLAMCANATAPPTPLAQLRTALEAADAGRLDPAQHRALQSHPVWPWIEYAALLHDLPQVSGMRAHDFLQRQQQSPVAELFFNQWLEELARRKDWAALLADWQP